MNKEDRFLEITQELRTLMVSRNAALSKKQIAEAFSEFGFDDGRISDICAFFENEWKLIKEQTVEVTTTESETADLSEFDNSDEKKRVNVLKMYLDELSEIKETDDETGRALLKQYMNGAKEQFNAVIEHYLPKVVEIAKLYENQGVLTEDLIGEGNMALTIGVQASEVSEDAEEAESTIIRMIMDAMEALVQEEGNDIEALKKAGQIVEEIGLKAEELYKAYGRDVTKEELAEAYELKPQDIEEALRISEGNIEHIKRDAE